MLHNKAVHAGLQKERVVMKKKYAALIFAVVLAVTSVSGCSGDTEDADAGALSGSDYAGSTVYGEVTDITDSVITVSVMEMNETAVDGTGGDADSTDGAGSTDDADSTADTDDAADTRAEGTDADDTAGDTTDDDAGDSVDDAAAGETTDDTAGDAGDVTGDGTGDAIPDGEDGGFSMFTGTGETLKITVTDDTTIYSMSMGPGGDMEMPGGDMGDGEAPEMPDGEGAEKEEDAESDNEE